MSSPQWKWLVTVVTVAVSLAALHPLWAYQLGVGIADVTGPIVQVGFMGYAQETQKGAGIHTRLFSRAFAISQDDGSNVAAFVSADICMIFHGVKTKVVAILQSKLGSNVYTEDNVMLTGSHIHAGPGGFSYHVLYDITTEGFQKDNHDAIANGIAESILQAHNNMIESGPGGQVLIGEDELLNTNINRSPTSYLANPVSERANYSYDVDKTMTLIRLQDGSGKDIGLFNWFPVHGTSMTNTNLLVSSDNKGTAAYLFEKYMNGPGSFAGMGPYISAFAQTSSGDVSPRTRGAFCPDGTPCDSVHSTCNGKNEGCQGLGPGQDEFESTYIIGWQQYQKALDIFNSDLTPLKGSVQWVHTFIDMENTLVSPPFSSSGQEATTCTGSMGDSFAAGTTDGPGALNFIQGSNSSTDNPFWNFIAHFLAEPSKELIACQAPKPILIDTGDVKYPAPWTVRYQPIQILRIGQLFLLGVPGEFTTMSGRRLRATTKQALIDAGYAGPDAIVVIAAIANSYGGYVATYEEYQYQRYEAASTLYGPHTLGAYQQEFARIAACMINGTAVLAGPTPPDLQNLTFNFLPPVLFDSTPIGVKFGDVYADALSSYNRSTNATATAIFWGGNPRNNFTSMGTFLTVDFLNTDSDGILTWEPIATDADWETKFRWKKQGVAASLVTVEWDIPQTAALGTYRLTVYGLTKQVTGKITPYSGSSRQFQVVS